MNRYFTVKQILEAIEELELDEQESSDTLTDVKPSTNTPTEPSKSSTPANVTKWESGVKRGKGNPIDDKKKWESGATRGRGNPIDDKKKWESGATRGKANPLN